jgi:CRP/FNR family transcriptional regulator, cyclic AMP receptor protein
MAQKQRSGTARRTVARAAVRTIDSVKAAARGVEESMESTASGSAPERDQIAQLAYSHLQPWKSSERWPVVADMRKLRFDAAAFLAKAGKGRTIANYRKGQAVFAQADDADAIYYVQKGRVKLTVVSNNGKEAVVAILGAGDFFGEGCLAGQQVRMSTAAAMSECAIARLEKAVVTRLLRDEPAFSELFLKHLLSRNIRIEEDLVDQLFNSSEKRLARVLLLLANFGKEGTPETVIPKISQETLAEIVGTTRSRVSFFMNKFRKLGFVEYNGELKIHSSLLNVVLHD